MHKNKIKSPSPFFVIRIVYDESFFSNFYLCGLQIEKSREIFYCRVNSDN